MTQRANERPEPQPEWSAQRQSWMFAAIVGGAMLAVVFPLLVGYRYAFRDLSHFYLPLYDYVSQRTSVEWLPWWNPLDQVGMPLIGETSTAVLYPIRYLVYSLPLRSESAMNAYLILHLILSACTAWWAAKLMGCNPLGRAVSALTYCFSGSVFSLCCNPPFLVGAAWLPLALSASLSHLPMTMGKRIRCVALAMVMMILGGDPQSALHSVLVVTSVILWRTIAQSGSLHYRSARVKHSILVCVGSVALAGGMASVQIAASLDWSLQSERTGQKTRLDQYDFSLAPWHVAEIVTARPFGKPFVPNALISKRLPGEGRMWTPTVYAGSIVAIALILTSLRFRDADNLDRLWLIIACVALALCFGHFGLVWWLQQIPGVLENTWSAIGGPYWVLESFLPGYGSFRYPVKWLPVFAIACSVLAGRWVCTTSSRRDEYVILSLAVLLAIAGAAVLLWVGSPEVESPHLADEYWGPLDSSSAARSIAISLLGSAVFFSVIAILRSQFTDVRSPQRQMIAATLLVVVCGADVATTAFTLLPKVYVEDELRLSHHVADEAIQPHDDRPTYLPMRYLRTQSEPWPRVWKKTASDHRAMEVAISERVSWFGRWHLADEDAVFNSMVSIRSKSVSEFWRATNQQLAGKSASDREALWGLIRRWLGMNGRVHVNGQTTIDQDGMRFVETTRIVNWNQNRFRIWEQWSGKEDIENILKRMLDSQSVPIPSIDGQPSSVDIAGHAEIEIEDSTTAVVHCETPVLLERYQFQDGNWHAEISAPDGTNRTSLVVHRCSVLNQAVVIPKGDWLVRFHYRPWWSSSMITLSIVCWLGFFTPWTRLRRSQIE